MAKPKEQTQTKAPHKQDKTSSWSAMRTLFTFKYHQTPKPKPKPQPQPLSQTQRQTQKQKQKLQEQTSEETAKKCKKMRCSGSLCSNTKVMHRPENNNSHNHNLSKTRANSNENNINNASSSSFSSTRSIMKAPLRELNVNSINEPSGSSGGSFRGMRFRRFYGCAECRMVVDPVLGIIKDPSLRTTICSCPDCGEIFLNSENLELHQAVRHAVSELGAEDTSKNIVEIIFQSSWLKKQTPVCKIDRILKVHNTQTTISRFEDYRETIKAKATKLPKKNPRCVADGNELLRFHCTTVSCQLGLRGSTNLCNSVTDCGVCSVIKNGFRDGEGKMGILTTATSGRAHDNMKAQDSGKVKAQNNSDGAGEGKRAMLVCRVIAGRVKKVGGGGGGDDGGGGGGEEGYKGNFKLEGVGEEYDSVAGEVGVYSNLDELYVFNYKSILPCFVVIYSL